MLLCVRHSAEGSDSRPAAGATGLAHVVNASSCTHVGPRLPQHQAARHTVCVDNSNTEARQLRRHGVSDPVPGPSPRALRVQQHEHGRTCQPQSTELLQHREPAGNRHPSMHHTHACQAPAQGTHAAAEPLTCSLGMTRQPLRAPYILAKQAIPCHMSILTHRECDATHAQHTASQGTDVEGPATSHTCVHSQPRVGSDTTPPASNGSAHITAAAVQYSSTESASQVSSLQCHTPSVSHVHTHHTMYTHITPLVVHRLRPVGVNCLCAQQA